MNIFSGGTKVWVTSLVPLNVGLQDLKNRTAKINIETGRLDRRAKGWRVGDFYKVTVSLLIVSGIVGDTQIYFAIKLQ